jgi:hypothetical protein
VAFHLVHRAHLGEDRNPLEEVSLHLHLVEGGNRVDWVVVSFAVVVAVVDFHT